jgi:phage tail sheath protein FI
MPAAYTYPGVYVEEVASGVHTISGVSTAETAFIDVFPRGPLDEAVRITSFADFERNFGGLDVRSEASYAIQQYYLNGGQIAWVVRVGPGNPTAASRTLVGGSPAQATLEVKAASEGLWGRNLEVSIRVDPTTPDVFDLLVRETKTFGARKQVVNSETHRNLSIATADPAYAVDVVNGASTLVVLTDKGLGAVPSPMDFQPLDTGGGDGTAFDDSGKLVDKAGLLAALKGDGTAKSGMFALDRIEPFIFNIMCLPVATLLDPTGMADIVGAASKYCQDKRAFLIVDIPKVVNKPGKSGSGMTQWIEDNASLRSDYAAVYFPRLKVPDPKNDGRLRDVGPSGTVAGVYARTDATRGVWKAPAGTDATIRGVRELVVNLTDLENGGLNQLGVNVIRTFPIFGSVIWGARTLDGADQKASEWKYIPVRRTALYIEESLFQGLKWVVFEPNDEPLWAQIRLNAGVFMHGLFRQGAFQGTTPREAYFVKCDKETTTQADIDRGIVNILVGFAPLKPAEFVVIRIQQMAGQLET